MRKIPLILNLLTLVIAFVVISCSNHDKKVQNTNQTNLDKATKRISVINVISPKNGEMFTVGDEIDVNIKLKQVDVDIDSLVIETKSNKSVINPNNLKFIWETKELNVGENQIRFCAYSKGKKIDSYKLKLRFKSDILPEILECKIINTYPHDKNAYTQGLQFDGGVMFEGTGQRGASSLRKVKFETGELISVLDMDAQYFGEGITLFGDKIIQLTYTSKIGFVYDKKNFKLINTFEYPTQGWGITTDGKKLIMSDGTQIIHFLDPEYFNQIGKVEVYDNNGLVDSVNELEFINGIVYANVYQSEEIIAFDPVTGKVLKRIDCRKIIPKGYEGETDNVLNGIAYDKDGGRFFITGKRWPYLYEVEFVK